jgi:hypothetical protein
MDPKLTMEVPPQVREFAQKSVDQAERVISSFIDSASKSIATEQLKKATGEAAAAAKDISKEEPDLI